VARGFFKDENLEPLLIQMRSQVTVPALIGGEVNYTLSFGNIIGSAMQGMPFKILAVLTDKPLHSIIARPEIKTISDLRGKKNWHATDRRLRPSRGRSDSSSQRPRSQRRSVCHPGWR
jgi:ABC-type nitrate/sulfonate/bicarbonate transport system substrate-binding protein